MNDKYLGNTDPYFFFSDINQKLIEEGLKVIKDKMLQRDEEIFLSQETKNLGFKPKGFKRRYFITILGEIRIKIRRYKYWDSSVYNETTKTYGKWKIKCLLLEDLKFEKYQKITHDLNKLILNHVADGKRIKDVNDMLIVKSLSYSSLARIINKLKFSLSRSENNHVVEKTSSEYIYIVVDDTFLDLKEENKKKKYRIRSCFFHQGHKQIQDRTANEILLNKKAYCKLERTGTRINTEEYAKNLREQIDKYYKVEANTKFIICGDGATWIQNLASIMNGEYVLDKFHAIRKIGTAFNLRCNYDRLQFKICKGLFNNGEYLKLINHLKFFKDNAKITKQWNLKSVMNYLKRRKKGVLAYKNEWCLSACAEALISHTIKAQLGHGNKIYSKSSFESILALRLGKINGVDIIQEMLDEQLANKEIEINNIKQAKWNIVNDKDTSHCATKNGDLPALKYHRTGTSEKIRGIVAIR